MAKRVMVIGGGIAGLAAAFRRASPGETVVLEADGRLGGSVRTLRENGFVLEAGPNTLRTTAAADRLIADLGLTPDLVLADRRAPRWIVRGGRPRAIVPGPKGLLNTALSTKGKLRLLGEVRAPRRPPGLEDESVHDFFVRRFGEDAATYGAGPMVSGVYAGDAASLSVRSAFPRLWDAEARSGSVLRDFIRGGGSFERNADGSKAPQTPRPHRQLHPGPLPDGRGAGHEADRHRRPDRDERRRGSPRRAPDRRVRAALDRPDSGRPKLRRRCSRRDARPRSHHASPRRPAAPLGRGRGPTPRLAGRDGHLRFPPADARGRAERVRRPRAPRRGNPVARGPLPRLALHRPGARRSRPDDVVPRRRARSRRSPRPTTRR